MIPASMSRAAFLCLLAGGCCIAFAPIFVRLSDTGPVASAFWRTALAAPLLWLWLFTRPSSPPSPQGQGEISPPPLGEGWEGGRHWPALVLAGLFFACDLGVWHWSIVWTSVAN